MMCFTPEIICNRLKLNRNVGMTYMPNKFIYVFACIMYIIIIVCTLFYLKNQYESSSKQVPEIIHKKEEQISPMFIASEIPDILIVQQD